MARLIFYGEPELSVHHMVDTKIDADGVTYGGPLTFWIGEQQVTRGEFLAKLAEMRGQETRDLLEQRLP